MTSTCNSVASSTCIVALYWLLKYALTWDWLLEIAPMRVQQRAIELLEATDDAAYSSDDVRYVTMHTP